MTQEEKDLLLKDLLPRLQYGVKIQTWYGEIITSDLNTFPIGYDEIDIEQLAGIKPYLRPMLSMTEDERYEFMRVDCGFNRYVWAHTERITDWLNKHMFDYRGLIEKGLAIEAPEGMYEISYNAIGNERD